MQSSASKMTLYEFYFICNYYKGFFKSWDKGDLVGLVGGEGELVEIKEHTAFIKQFYEKSNKLYLNWNIVFGTMISEWMLKKLYYLTD